MHEEVENCEIIAPRISEKLVVEQAKEAKYEVPKLGNMKSVEDAVLPNQIAQDKINADYTVIPIKPQSEQNDCHPPKLFKEELEQNNVPPIIHRDETKDSITSSLIESEPSLEEDLLIAEVVGKDFCDLPKTKAGSNEYLATVLQKTVNALDVNIPLASIDSETKMAKNNENIGQEKAQNSNFDEKQLKTIPIKDIVNDTPTNNSQDESEIITSQIEESLVKEPSEKETECKEVSVTVAFVNEEPTEKDTDTQDALKEEVTTSSNQNLEEAEAIPSAKEDHEDNEDSSPEGEERECPFSNDKTESVYDDTDTSSSEDEENSIPCRAMKGRDYFSFYQKHKKKEHYSLYPIGKVFLPRGFLLHFHASTRREVIHMKREYIRDALLPLGAEIAFIDYQKGELCGWVRFQESCPAIKILKQMTNNTILIKTVYMVFKKVPKKDEVKYLNHVGKEMAKLRKNKSSLENKLKKKGLKFN